MPPRRFSGGRQSSVVNPNILHRRLESCKSKYRTVEEIVDHLRSSYPDYSRIKQQPLTRVVRQALESLSPSSSKKRKNQRQAPIIQDDSDEEEVDRVTTSRKKSKKVDKSEERLRRIEDSYIRRNQYANSQDSSSTNSDDSAEEDDDDDEDGEDGLVSTSEDAIYEQKVEPVFDLTKSMLLDRYVKSKPKKKVEESANATQEENMEVDVNSDKSKQQIEAIGGSDEKAEGKGLPSESSRKVGNLGIEESRFNDFGGMKEIIEQLKMEVLVPLYHPQLPRELGIKAIRGILFHGPPGCGKTKLAHAIANETGLPFYKISATEVVSGVSGASEENIRDLFSKAYRTAPSIVFIDEIDAIASKRENLQREMERRIVTQLMTCMDESHRPAKSSSSDKDAVSGSSATENGHVLVIGATNRPDAVDSALRRPGRFDLEICLGVPDENARLEILSVVTRNHKLEGSFDLRKIARSTPGFVGADLTALANKAGIIAMNRTVKGRKVALSEDHISMDQNDEWKEPFLPEDLTKLSITMADYEEAAKSVQPSLRREGFSTTPNVKWEDVGGLDSLREEFNQYIIGRIKYPEKYEKFGLDLETGFLLFGPPGCGKTLIAKAVANEAGANFIHIKGPELLNKYVGESEQAVRTLFNRARTCSPCILFFDEVDALTKQRGTEGGWVVERVLNQLLIELDGGKDRRGVFVIGATNRIDVIDNALLRPGRFGKLHYVRLPSAKERSLILKALSRNKAIDPDVDLDSFARMEACEDLSGADLNALMNEAGMAATEDDDAPETIKLAHFEKALAKISPSVSKMEIQVFDRLAKQFKAESH